MKTKLKKDTGGGCSICGNKPVVNIQGTYWLCGDCARDSMDLNEGIIAELKQEIILLRESRDTHKTENIELKKELDKNRILCLRRGSRIYQLER
jgi:hypothetical protein